MSALETAHKFVKAINSTDIHKLAALMTEDHLFIDADGSKHSGFEKMREGWLNYFSMVPDYKINISDSFSKDNLVVLIGTAEGTFIKNRKLKNKNHWKVPAAWRVEVKENKVKVWQLFTNQEPMVRIYNSK